MTPPRPVARAWDESGRDVTELVARQDGRYLATFARGDYQGIARGSFRRARSGPEIPRETPRMWLVANGWIYPTDSSINVAIGQGHQDPTPRPVARGAGRSGPMGRRVAGPWVSGGQEQDDPDRPHAGRRARASRTRGGCGCGRTWRSTGTRLAIADDVGERADGACGGSPPNARISGIAGSRRPTSPDATCPSCRATTRSRTSRRAGAISSATTRVSATSASSCAVSTIGTSS